MKISIKELFYSAMLLGTPRIVGVSYDFPHDYKERLRELDEVKRELYKRKLLRENSRGEISLGAELRNFVELCAEPKKCTVAGAEPNATILYIDEDKYMLLRKLDGDECEVTAFEDEQSALLSIKQL